MRLLHDLIVGRFIFCFLCFGFREIFNFEESRFPKVFYCQRFSVSLSHFNQLAGLTIIIRVGGHVVNPSLSKSFFIIVFYLHIVTSIIYQSRLFVC